MDLTNAEKKQVYRWLAEGNSVSDIVELANTRFGQKGRKAFTREQAVVFRRHFLSLSLEEQVAHLPDCPNFVTREARLIDDVNDLQRLNHLLRGTDGSPEAAQQVLKLVELKLKIKNRIANEEAELEADSEADGTFDEDGPDLDELRTIGRKILDRLDQTGLH